MSAAGGPGRTCRLCRQCGAMTGADDNSLMCSCGYADFEEVPSETTGGSAGAAGQPRNGVADPPPVAAGPAARPTPPPAGTRDRAAAGLLPLGERWLQVTFTFDDQSWQLEVPPGAEVELGRDPGYSRYAVDLADDDTVSRCHAVIGLDADGSPWIRDVGSINGTFVNSRRLPQRTNRSAGGQARYPLRNGDRLQLGEGTMGKVWFVPAPRAASQS
jgi:hypothetical protein